MNTQDAGDARAIARTVIQRVVGDSAFAESLRSDPRTTLLHAGFPDWAADDFVAHDLGLEADVAGYSMERCAVTSLLWIDGDGVDAQ